MEWVNSIHSILVIIQRCVSFLGILIILSGVVAALGHYLYFLFTGQLIDHTSKKINTIRFNLARILLLGLEFIVAGDLIGTTTTPDYYTVGILAIIVLIRTVLSYSINRELAAIKKE